MLDDFEPGTVTDALPLPAGSHDLAVRGADAAATDAPRLSATAALTAGQHVSIAAHLGADGQPRLIPFADATGVPLGTVKGDLRRGLDVLRRVIGATGG